MIGLTPAEEVLSSASEIDKLLRKINGPTYEFAEARQKFDDMLAFRSAILWVQLRNSRVNNDLLSNNAEASKALDGGDLAKSASRFKFANFALSMHQNGGLQYVEEPGRSQLKRMATQLEAEMRTAVSTNKVPVLLSAFLSGEDSYRRAVVEKWMADNP